METNAFGVLGNWYLASQSRLLPAACCPDKDLVALISRLGGRDRLSLWKVQGSKTWEVDVGLEDTDGSQIVAIAWSPDGQSIAVAHDPPCITLHSIHDGHKESSLSIKMPSSAAQRKVNRLTSLWWFRDENPTDLTTAPDIFKRNDVITGSAHSILKILPLLDHLQEESKSLTATDLFAFQGSQTQNTTKSNLPPPINNWPALSTDLDAASIGSVHHKDKDMSLPGEADQSNINSLLVAADSLGYLYCFLDGSFPLGAILISAEVSASSLVKHPLRPLFYTHPRYKIDNHHSCTEIQPLTVKIPMLTKRHARDLARLSSSARELVWYTMRVVRDMRAVWFGFEGIGGARELGPKWIRALESKQKEQYGQEEPNPFLDLTCLLLTGRASDPLADFLGSGDQMSERGIQKWETTVTEALIKLRDFSEKRVAPACQRLHLILEELQGWSQLPQYAAFELPKDDLSASLELSERAIVIASWLTAVARRELTRFKEFISWLRFETIVANPSNDTTPTPRHDILEVNNYFMSGLVVSSIDKWFMGPVSQFNARDLGVTGDERTVADALRRARNVINDPTQLEWQANITYKDLNHLDRNLDALVQELAKRCHRVFDRAAGATSRSVIISIKPESPATRISSQNAESKAENKIHIRDRIVTLNHEWHQYLIMWTESQETHLLYLVRIGNIFGESVLPPRIEVALLECSVGEESNLDLDLLEADFFDDECVVIVYRLRDKDVFIATLPYNDLGYQELQANEYVKVAVREDLMLALLDRWKHGQLAPVRIPIKRCRALVGCRQGSVSLAINGRTGRRIACVLDSKGTSIESFDLEGDGDDMEVEPGEPEVGADDEDAV